MLTRALIIVAGVLGLALAGMGYWLSNVIESRAAARASLNTALEANASLVGEAKRSKADAAAEADRAMQRQRERDNMAGALAELRQALGDDSCAWTPERARAVDEFLNGRKQ